MDLWPPHTDWVAPEIPSWDPEGVPFAIDLETKDEGIAEGWGAGWPVKKGHICGVAVAIPGAPPAYLPFNHLEGNGNYDQKKILEWVAWCFKRAKIVVNHNIGYDLGWLQSHGIPMPENIFDTQVASALLDEHRKSYSLDGVGKDYGFKGKDEKLLYEAAKYYNLGESKSSIMSSLWKLPASYVGGYAEQDAALALELYAKMREELIESDMTKLTTVEMTMVKLTVAMRTKGIRVDVDKAESLNEQWKADQVKIQDQIKSLTGLALNPSDHNDLEILAKHEDIIDIPTTEKKQAHSFKNEWMSSLHLDSFDLCVKYRKIQHSRNNYIEGVILNQSIDGRVYPEVNTVKRDEGGTVSGRISVNNPALQQISVRNPDVGPPVRSCFLPERGEYWGAFDYSQQEPRMSVHFASLLKISGAAEAVEYYRNDPSADFHSMMAEVSGLARTYAKDLFLGMVYGMGNAKMAMILNIDAEECKKIRDKFNQNVPWVDMLSKRCLQRAASAGYIRTLLGRRARFPLWEPQGRRGFTERVAPLPEFLARKKWGMQNLKRAFTWRALNRLIQGSSADQTKMSMAAMYDEGIIPMLQMHDELDVSLPSKDCPESRKVKEIMEHIVELQVPSKVDFEFGDNWGGAK